LSYEGVCSNGYRLGNMTRPLTLVRVVGTRPQFMQVAPLRRELARRGHRETLVHTGQHYDEAMSRLFFEDLCLEEPDVNLGIGSAGHGEQTGRMMGALEQFLVDNPCDAVVVDGDTNSTLAGALVASKMHIPLVHVEAGLRSSDRTMPEEINRVVTDHISSLLCAPTATAVANLAREGLSEFTVRTGDLMYDCFLSFKGRARREILAQLSVEPGGYFLATVHRAENVDDPGRLQAILGALAALDLPVIFPVHPRTRQRIDGSPARSGNLGALRLVGPVGYLEMLALEAAAKCIFTDSGGVQREAFFWGVPSVVLREVTEWRELLEGGWSVLAGWRRQKILDAYESLDGRYPEVPSQVRDEIFGGGRAAGRVADAIEGLLS